MTVNEYMLAIKQPPYYNIRKIYTLQKTLRGLG